MELNIFELQKLIERCLREDLGAGDLTTNSTVPAGAVSTGYILAKEDGVIAGLPLVEMIFRRLDPSVEFRPLARDGDHGTGPGSGRNYR